MIFDVGIVGAGMAGVAAAKALCKSGLSVLVLEKSRGLGGRMATRRQDDGTRYDHGAQYFTLRDEATKALVQRFIDSGDVQVWAERFSDSTRFEPRYIVRDGMSRLARLMIADDSSIQISTNSQVHGIERIADRRYLIRGREDFVCNSVIITAPPPQVLPLLSNLDDLDQGGVARLSVLTFEPCLALLVRHSQQSQIPAPGGAWPGPSSSFSWVADQQEKGVSENPASVFHVNSTLSEQFLESPEDIVGVVKGELQSWLGEDNEILEVSVHRWRYAKPRAEMPIEGLVLCVDKPGGLFVAGDALSGGRVEGALLSGLAAAEAVTRLLRAMEY